MLALVALSAAFLDICSSQDFPNPQSIISVRHGTLAVNVLGSLLIGLLAGIAESRPTFTTEARLFLIVGVVGGFTTFSAFAWETFALPRKSVGALNIAVQLLLGLSAVWMGHLLGLAINRFR